jgi:tetratricopeptide (TPR) repeat protein
MGMAKNKQGKPGIFISHTHADKAIADAIDHALKQLFEGAVEVHYSTKTDGDGGIAKGENWFQWIGSQVRQSTAAIIILTPSSIQKSWVLWEAGAVAGTALATTGATHRKVLPIIYRLSNDEVPDPLRHTQVTRGEDEADVEALFTGLLDDFTGNLDRARLVRAGKGMKGAIGKYLKDVDRALGELPLPISEATVQEWLERIQAFGAKHRASDIDQLCDWMNTTFGYDKRRKPQALDLRLHRRLGELYARGKEPAKAAAQFELARRLAPRDIYILRSLGKAYLDRKDGLDEAKTVIAAIAKFDPNAFSRDIEAASFKARWHREKGDLAGAAETLAEAVKSNPQDHYLKDNLAQIKAELGRTDDARELYRDILKLIDGLDPKDQTIWTRATGLNAALVLGDQVKSEWYREVVVASRPNPGEIESIDRGLKKISQAFGINVTPIG